MKSVIPTTITILKDITPFQQDQEQLRRDNNKRTEKD